MLQVAEKPCIKCSAVKPLHDYYRHPDTADRRQGLCKECQKSATKAARAANREYYQKYDLDRAFDPERVAARKAYAALMKGNAEFQKKARERKALWAKRRDVQRRAHIMAGNAIRDKRLIPSDTCERCHRTANTHGHHENYYKPLEVVWLCQECHGLRHREINEMKRSGIDMGIKGFGK